MDIAITGIGAGTPLGCTYRTIADNLLAGKSGIRKVTRFSTDDHPSRIAGTVDDIPVPAGFDAEAFGLLPAVDRLTLWCCAEALRDAGRQPTEGRIGMILGTSAEWITIWEWDALAGGKEVHLPQEHRQSLACRTSRHLRISGPATSLSAACASGNHALALARTWLRMGLVDVCLAGGCDMAMTPITLAGFGNLRALSRRNDDAPRASRPFDRQRDGFVLSEGGVMFVLEPLPVAQKRSARIYGRVAGFGASSDAFHMVIPSSNPAHAAAAMRQALVNAGIRPDQVDYVNAHATGTSVGDVCESRALQSVFGADLSRVPVSSTKSMTGHLLTAAAAMEALACIVAIENQALPPTINLDDPDPECPLSHVPNQARPHSVRFVASNSFGFGGCNTCLILAAS